MGKIIEIFCDVCKYRRVFNLGRSATKESAFEALKCFSEDLITTIKQMDAAYDMTDYDYGEGIYLCKNCNDLDTKMVFKIKFKNSAEFIPKHFCNKCNTALKLLENLDSIKACNCPGCRSLTLRYKDICNWD